MVWGRRWKSLKFRPETHGKCYRAPLDSVGLIAIFWGVVKQCKLKHFLCFNNSRRWHHFWPTPLFIFGTLSFITTHLGLLQCHFQGAWLLPRCLQHLLQDHTPRGVRWATCGARRGCAHPAASHHPQPEAATGLPCATQRGRAPRGQTRRDI